MRLNDNLQTRGEPPEVLPGIIGVSGLLKSTAARVPLIAESDATCLILGETGTGKELFAHAIHYLSHRKHQPFVPVNCGAIPDSLFENELFGHARGAYTDASSHETGLVAYAENGALFLDEIHALTPSAQVKLLRLLQEHEYRPVGSARKVPANIRIIAATNIDLEKQVREGRFREDLFYRVNVLRLSIPPLRERPSDIEPLARNLLRQYAAEHHRTAVTLDAAVIQRLAQYAWPGNVRELQAVLHRAVLMARGPFLTTSDFDIAETVPAAAVSTTLQAAKEVAIRQFERTYLADVLKRCNGNITQAARAAGKERRSFQRLLRKHSINATRFQSA